MAVESIELAIPGVTGRANVVKLAGSVDPTTGASSSSVSVKALLTCLGYEQISSATLAAPTQLTVPEGSTIAIIQNNGTQAARFRPDGVAPTASTGQRIAAGEFYSHDAELSDLILIREAAGAVLDIAYYRDR
jgi:hypothetical protein